MAMPTFIRTKPELLYKTYKLYRKLVRRDFKGCCAYCGIHENDWPHGGRNYHLDHFRPKSRPAFRHLTAEYTNLYYCCHVCNAAKSDDWPAPELESQGIGFLDLCTEDWQNHYDLLPDGTLLAKSTSASYTIEKLRLNNPDHKRLRQSVRENGRTIFEDW